MEHPNQINIDIHKLHTDFEDMQFDEQNPLGSNQGVQIRQLVTSDVYEQACNITAWQQLYDQIYPGQFSGCLSEVWLDGMQFFKESTNLAVRQSCVAWPDAIWFGLPRAKSRASYVCSSRVADGSIAVRQSGHAFELLTPDNLDIMGLVVLQSELEQYISLSSQKLSEALASNAALQVGTEKKAAYWTLMDQALHVAEFHPHRMKNPAVHKVMKDGLLTGMIDLLSGSNPAGKNPPQPDELPAHCQRNAGFCAVAPG